MLEQTKPFQRWRDQIVYKTEVHSYGSVTGTRFGIRRGIIVDINKYKIIDKNEQSQIATFISIFFPVDYSFNSWAQQICIKPNVKNEITTLIDFSVLTLQEIQWLLAGGQFNQGEIVYNKPQLRELTAWFSTFNQIINNPDQDWYPYIIDQEKYRIDPTQAI